MKKILILLFISSLFLIPNQIFALSCPEPSSPEMGFEDYDAVLIGSVEKIETDGEIKTLTINVEKSFKGVDEKIIMVKEDMMWGDSQTYLKYLYFLNKEGEDWVHPLCSPTTHSIEIEDEFYADKEEIILQEVESTGNELNNVSGIMLVAVLFVASAAVFLITMIKRRKKTESRRE